MNKNIKIFVERSGLNEKSIHALARCSVVWT